MKSLSNTGQTLILFLIIIPLLLLIGGIIFRTGKTLLIHNRLQSHCDRKVLDTLMWQARGLQQLGLINPYAKLIISARRVIDKAIVSAAATPYLIPPLMAARAKLKKTQKLIAAAQKKTVTRFISLSAQEAHRKVPFEFDEKIIEKISPSTPFLPHHDQESMTMHTQEIAEYKGETGAPLKLDSDFNSRQVATGKIRMSTENFLEPWPHLKTLSDINLSCGAAIKMEKLEGPWQVELRPVTDKP